MNKPILIAGLLSLITVAIHIIAGGTDVHIPLLNSDLSVGLKAISSILWHGISIVLIFNTVALFFAIAPSSYQRPLILLVSSQYLAFATLFILYGFTRLGSLLIMPQWSVFIVIAILALIGLRQDNIKSTLAG